MDKIMDLLNNFSIEKYVPKLDSVMDVVQKAIELAVRVGPLCILVLGLIYLLFPPKEANHQFGFRTYFGMGSIPAWLFTQRVAGGLMTIVGLILLLTARSAVKKFAGMDLMEMSEKAFALIKSQIIWALIIYVVMFLLTAVLFNHKGQYRFRKDGTSAFEKLLPKEPVRKKAKKDASVQELPEETEQYAEEEIPEELDAPEEEIPVEYEKQGEQVITADDIVIEGLD